jgi:antitoxin (DNA-binding transcriptional repressor) of toxin-antitoxin stability system
MSEMTATVAETRANFSKIANTVNQTGRPVTVFKNSKPWVLVAPVGKGYGDRIPNIDWSSQDVVKLDDATRKTILPAEWDDPEDEGLYDDLV